VTAPHSILTHGKLANLRGIFISGPVSTVRVSVHATRGSLLLGGARGVHIFGANSSDLTVSGTTARVDRVIGGLALDLGQDALSDVTVVATDGVSSNTAQIHVTQLTNLIIVGHRQIGPVPTRRIG
jgi:hypothetical protein